MNPVVFEAAWELTLRANGPCPTLWAHVTSPSFLPERLSHGAHVIVQKYATAQNLSQRGDPPTTVIGQHFRDVHIPTKAFSLTVLPVEYRGTGYVDSRLFDNVYMTDMRRGHDSLTDGGILLTALPASTFADAPRGSRFMQYLATHFTLEDAFQISGSRFFAVLVLRRTPYQHGASQKAGERFLQDVRLHIERPLPCIPTLDLEVPAGKAWALPDFFSYVPDPWEAEALLCASTLFQKTTQIARRAHDARPPMPLRLGHVALQLATGHLDGVVGEGEERHIVRGRVLRTKVEEQLGPDEIISRDILSTEIRALTKEGRPVNLMSQSEGGESA